jgi:hypothetical protein
MMQRLGVSLDLIGRCQNVVMAGSRVRRDYLHHDYAAEKREAWARLGERIKSLLDDRACTGAVAGRSNPVPFHTASLRRSATRKARVHAGGGGFRVDSGATFPVL